MSQPRKLTIAGFTLPYFVIIVVVVMVISQAGTYDEKWSKIGISAFVLPLLSAFIGAILVGIGSVRKAKLEERGKSFIHAFLFGFLWTAIFHFFITIYFIMQIVYAYAGGLKL